MKETLVLAIFAGMVLAVGSPSPARAAEACDLRAEAAELAAAQADTSLDESRQLKAEIAARRKLFIAAIECDQAEIAARKDTLEKMPESIKSVKARREILENLGSVYDYYERRKENIRKMELRDLKSLSRSMIDWRKDTYVPAVTWADNFFIWADNQQFLERASERLAQVSRVAFSLKLVNQDEVNKLFEESKGKLETAFAENDKAREALDQKRPLEALTHTQSSLKALAETYDIFFAIQKALQKIVK